MNGGTSIFTAYAAALWLLITPVSAAATPPDVIDVTDELFGISQTHVFVLRHTDDNLGMYTVSARHVFLVAINLATAEEEYWPLFLAVRSERFDENANSVGMVISREYRPIEINPYDILGERAALPVGSAFNLASSFPKPVINVTADFVTATVEGKATHQLPRAVAEARIETSNSNLAQRVWEPARMYRQYTTKQAFAERKVALEECAYSDAGQLWTAIDKPRVQLVQATCSDADETGVTSVIFALDPMPASPGPSTDR